VERYNHRTDKDADDVGEVCKCVPHNLGSRIWQNDQFIHLFLCEAIFLVEIIFIIRIKVPFQLATIFRLVIFLLQHIFHGNLKEDPSPCSQSLLTLVNLKE